MDSSGYRREINGYNWDMGSSATGSMIRTVMIMMLPKN
jgi:hypothetical protein